MSRRAVSGSERPGASDRCRSRRVEQRVRGGAWSRWACAVEVCRGGSHFGFSVLNTVGCLRILDQAVRTGFELLAHPARSGRVEPAGRSGRRASRQSANKPNVAVVAPVDTTGLWNFLEHAVGRNIVSDITQCLGGEVWHPPGPTRPAVAPPGPGGRHTPLNENLYRQVVELPPEGIPGCTCVACGD